MREPYDRNTTRLIDDYPDFSIRAGFEGFGHPAQKRRMALHRRRPPMPECGRCGSTEHANCYPAPVEYS